MSYIVNRTDGNIATVVDDGVINTTTSLSLVGKGVANYAETIAENLIGLLENHAGPLAPRNPLSGQLWYNKSIGQIQVYDGSKQKFKLINNVTSSSAKPSNPANGDFWYNTANRQLLFFRDNVWQLIAPSYAENQGRCELVVETFEDRLHHKHSVISLFSNNLRTAVISSDPEFFTFPNLDGFEKIYPGINIASTYSGISGAVLSGTSTFAQTAYGLDEIADANYMHANADASTVGNLTVTNSNFTLGLNSDLVISADGTNSLIKANSNAPLTLNGAGGSTLKLDNATNWIAINKTVPTADLDVGGAINADETITSQNGYYFADSSEITSTEDIISISPGGTNTLTVDSLGDVFVTGNISGANLIASSSGIYFPDGTLQTTAAVSSTDNIVGSGIVGRLAYFPTTTSVAATDISTDNASLTLTNRVLSVRNESTPTLILDNYTTTPWLGLPYSGKIDFSGLASIDYLRTLGQVDQSITINPGTNPRSSLKVGIVGGVPGTIVTGTLTVDGNGIKFSDGTRLTTAPNNLQISYPTTVVSGNPFKWSVSGGKSNETWYATYTTATRTVRIPESGVLSLDINGATPSYNNGSFDPDIGDVELKFYFSDSGTFVKRVTILAPAGTTYTLPTSSSSTLGGVKVGSGLSINTGTGVLSTVFNDPGYGGIGSYTMTSASGVTEGEINVNPAPYQATYYNPLLPGPTGARWRKMGSALSQNIIIDAQDAQYQIQFDLWLRIS